MVSLSSLENTCGSQRGRPTSGGAGIRRCEAPRTQPGSRTTQEQRLRAAADLSGLVSFVEAPDLEHAVAPADHNVGDAVAGKVSSGRHGRDAGALLLGADDPTAINGIRLVEYLSELREATQPLMKSMRKGRPELRASSPPLSLYLRITVHLLEKLERQGGKQEKRREAESSSPVRLMSRR